MRKLTLIKRLFLDQLRRSSGATTEIAELRAWLKRTESARSPIRTRREALRVPASTVIATPGFNPSRVISRKAAGSRSDTLLITAGTPHAHFDNSTSSPHRKRAASLGDRVPVRIGFRVAQFRGDPVFQSLRDEVLQPFRLIVNLVPRVVEDIMEEALQQTVVAKNLQGAHLPRWRQTHAMMLFVFHERRLLRRQLLQHSRDGSRADAEMLRRGRCWSPAPLRGRPAPGSLSDSRLPIPCCTVHASR